MWANDTVYQFGDYGCMSCTGPGQQSNMYIAFRKAGQTGWMKLSFSLNNGTCTVPITATIHLILAPCIPINVPELNGTNNVTVQPNPLNETALIITEQPMQNGTLLLYNSQGQLVQQEQNLNGSSFTLHRDQLAEGVYFLHLTEDGVTVSTRKLVIAD